MRTLPGMMRRMSDTSVPEPIRTKVWPRHGQRVDAVL